MRIAQVAPLAESVPPKLYGGTERVVAWLTEELVKLGHDVTLFATADSQTSAKLVPVWPRAAKVPRSERGYFKNKLEPQIDGEQIFLTGEVDDQAKQKFLAGAAALLFPIDWPEPFGLVMIEAMACGTPVIAFRSGSVPEVVDDGITGFVVEDETEATQAIKRLGELDRRKVRSRFEERFTARRMAIEYVRHYEGLIAKRPDVPLLIPSIAVERTAPVGATMPPSPGFQTDSP